MYTRLSLRLKNLSDQRITWNMSSVFQGLLMELVPADTAQWLHSGSRQPYSQWIKADEDSLVWTVNTMTREACEKIIIPMQDPGLTEFYLRQHDLRLQIEERKVQSCSEEDFLQDQYFTDYQRHFTIHFRTPASFKSNGRYQNYPTMRWLFQSLMNKYDSLEGSNQLYDAKVLEVLAQQSEITGYQLRSTRFHLEGTSIPAFTGRVSIRMHSNQNVVNLVNYLLMYGTYAGVGIKSAIGMGAVEIDHKKKNDLLSEPANRY